MEEYANPYDHVKSGCHTHYEHKTLVFFEGLQSSKTFQILFALSRPRTEPNVLVYSILDGTWVHF